MCIPALVGITPGERDVLQTCATYRASRPCVLLLATVSQLRCHRHARLVFAFMCVLLLIFHSFVVSVMPGLCSHSCVCPCHCFRASLSASCRACVHLHVCAVASVSQLRCQRHARLVFTFMCVLLLVFHSFVVGVMPGLYSPSSGSFSSNCSSAYSLSILGAFAFFISCSRP